MQKEEHQKRLDISALRKRTNNQDDRQRRELSLEVEKTTTSPMIIGRQLKSTSPKGGLDIILSSEGSWRPSPKVSSAALHCENNFHLSLAGAERTRCVSRRLRCTKARVNTCPSGREMARNIVLTFSRFFRAEDQVYTVNNSIMMAVTTIRWMPDI